MDSHLQSRFFQGKGNSRLALTEKCSQSAPAVTSFSGLEFGSATNQISRNISKIKPKTRGNSVPITAPKTAPAALTAAIPLKPSSGNASNRKKYAIGAMIPNKKAPNSAANVRLIIFVHSELREERVWTVFMGEKRDWR